VPGDRVLVVDDDESIRLIVRLCLSDAGYVVAEAANGQAALAMADEFQPALIILDLRMPIMDGWEFIRQYRARPGLHAPIVGFVAALDAAEECRDLELDGLVSKPFDLDDLLQTVRSQIPIVT